MLDMDLIEDRVLVLLDPLVTETSSGIVLNQEIEQLATRWGEVIKVGPGMTTSKGVAPMSCSIGDRVLVDMTKGQEVKIDGKHYVYYHDPEIIMIMDS